MTTDKALKLALEALEAWLPTWPNLIEKQKTAITAIKQARSAPEQEPLEEEWIAYCWNKSLIGHRISYVQYLEFVREVERAHGIKEKNT